MKLKSKLPPGIELTDDFKEMVNNALTALEVDCNEALLEIIDEHKPDYAELQEALTKAETALETIALRHPEWFTHKQSVPTPFGTVKFYNGTKLEVANEEVTILLIEQQNEKARRAGMSSIVIDGIRTEKKLNLEALEKLDDAELLALRIKRVPNKSFSVKPARIDMGKAVKEAAQQEAA